MFSLFIPNNNSKRTNYKYTILTWIYFLPIHLYMRSFKYLSEHNYFTGYHTPRWRQPCYRKKFILMTHPQQLRYQRASFLLAKSLLLGWSSCLHGSDAFFLLTSCKQGQGQRKYSRLRSQLPPAGIYLEQAPVLPRRVCSVVSTQD